MSNAVKIECECENGAALLFVAENPPQCMTGEMYMQFTVVPEDRKPITFEVPASAIDPLLAFLSQYTGGTYMPPKYEILEALGDE